jgi:REP element-mobilizing transposase RayT
VRRDRPLHVTVRLLAGLPTIRRARQFRAIRAAIAITQKSGFRVVHFAVMSNHLHFLVEAQDRKQLSRGMQGLKISIAKRLNRTWGRRRGSVFGERFHATELATPTQVRNALLYVLGNARRHAAERGRRLPGRWVDPFSSARQFDGWRQPVRLERGVVTSPATWLLRVGWRRCGLLDAHAIPTKGPPG